MAKLILNNLHFGDKEFPNSDKPFYIPVSQDIWDLVAELQLDLSSEIFDIYLTAKQKRLFESRAKNFYLTTYLPFGIIRRFCEDSDVLNAFAISPCHDMDIDDNGNYKKPHFHLILQYNTNYAYSKVVSTFHTTELRRLGEFWYNEFPYLWHGTEKCLREGKYLYDKNELYCSDLNYFELKSKIPTKSLTFSDMIFDLESGKSERYMAEKYSFLWARYKSACRECVIDIRREETEKE